MRSKHESPLRDVREATGRTQQQVADAIKVQIATYRNWEQGRTEPNGEKLSTLADYFGVSTDRLLGRQGRTMHEHLCARIQALTDAETKLVDEYVTLLINQASRNRIDD